MALTRQLFFDQQALPTNDGILNQHVSPPTFNIRENQASMNILCLQNGPNFKLDNHLPQSFEEDHNNHRTNAIKLLN